MLKAIMAVNQLGYIGLNGDLPWGRECPKDLKHFKSATMGQRLLVGANTFRGLPKLSGRELVVVGSDYHSLDAALSKDCDWIIGGKSIYEQTMDKWDILYLSVIIDNTIGDTMCPDLSRFKGQKILFEFETNVEQEQVPLTTLCETIGLKMS